MQRKIYCVIIVIVFFACSSPSDPTKSTYNSTPDFEAIETEITTLVNSYNMVFADGNVDSLLSYYEADALRIPEREPLNRGVKEIIRVIEEFNAEHDYVLIETGEVEFRTTENLVVAYSTFVDYWVPKAGGETTHRDGRWITVWRKQDDGSWKISMEMWNNE